MYVYCPLLPVCGSLMLLCFDHPAFQPVVRENLPWDALLYVYATFLVPVLFALLVGINIWVWTRSRINYQFIFGKGSYYSISLVLTSVDPAELDVRTQLDSREYFEVSLSYLFLELLLKTCHSLSYLRSF